MTIRSVCYRELASASALAQAFARPHCPRCADVMLVAEESEFDAGGRILHTWSCDSCGHEFRTAISLRRR